MVHCCRYAPDQPTQYGLLKGPITPQSEDMGVVSCDQDQSFLRICGFLGGLHCLFHGQCFAQSPVGIRVVMGVVYPTPFE